MMQVISPRQWIHSEAEKLIEILNRESLTDEEKVALALHNAVKIRTNILNSLFYNQDLK